MNNINGKEKNILKNYIITNENKDWEFLNKVNKINNKKQNDIINNKRKLLDSLTLCSLEFINNIELSHKQAER